ncbi:MAG: hypothetical protein K0V04_41605 [Deltaproteobacteria bacterium]|nr:hypothetical protein [Deltaproteobacteria bacterium]
MQGIRLSIGLVIGVAAGVTAGCLLQLDEGPACGDNYFDRAHEECDASEEGSVVDGLCADGIPSCDPTTCMLGCCGDGRLQNDEECDGNSVRTPPNCGDWTCETCQVVCPDCGNSRIDANEECDPGLENLADSPRDCSEIEVPGLGGVRYLPGGNPHCDPDDCTWNLDSCSLCGDGIQDPPIINPVGGIVVRIGEQCDGDDFHLDDLTSACASKCQTGLLCDATCGSSCNIQVSQDAECCIPDGVTRQNDGVTRCCCQLAQFNDGIPCQPQVFEPPGGGGEPATISCPASHSTEGLEPPSPPSAP